MFNAYAPLNGDPGPVDIYPDAFVLEGATPKLSVPYGTMSEPFDPTVKGDEGSMFLSFYWPGTTGTELAHEQDGDAQGRRGDHAFSRDGEVVQDSGCRHAMQAFHQPQGLSVSVPSGKGLSRTRRAHEVLADPTSYNLFFHRRRLPEGPRRQRVLDDGCRSLHRRRLRARSGSYGRRLTTTCAPIALAERGHHGRRGRAGHRVPLRPDGGRLPRRVLPAGAEDPLKRSSTTVHPGGGSRVARTRGWLLGSLCGLVLATGLAAGCSSSSGEPGAPPSDGGPLTFPRTTAPPSRHDALHDALRDEARHFSFADGDWLEDYGDAPYYGMVTSDRLGDVARRDAAVARSRALMAGNLLEGDVQEKVMSALGRIELAAERSDPTERAELDDFVDRLGGLARALGYYLDLGGGVSWALRTYGPTTVSALIGLVHAQHALLLGGERAEERVQFARDMEARIGERAFASLPAGAESVQAYRFGKEREGLLLYPNVAMVLLKGRLFRLTHEERYRAEAVALWGAVQSLKLPEPGRYYSEYSAAAMGARTRDYSTLSEHNYVALALWVLFEITGEARYVEEGDQVLDAIERMRGRWCLSHVHREAGGCGGACAALEACVADACVADRCQDGILHHLIDGRRAEPEDPSFFCSGCNLQSLYVLDYRRWLAAPSPPDG